MIRTKLSFYITFLFFFFLSHHLYSLIITPFTVTSPMEAAGTALAVASLVAKTVFAIADLAANVEDIQAFVDKRVKERAGGRVLLVKLGCMGTG
jgi:hypothetical protein